MEQRKQNPSCAETMGELKYIVCPICEKTDYWRDGTGYYGLENDFIVAAKCWPKCAKNDEFLSQRVDIYNYEGFFTRRFEDVDDFYRWSQQNKNREKDSYEPN